MGGTRQLRQAAGARWQQVIGERGVTVITLMKDEITLKSRVQIAEGVLFQELQGEAVLLNLTTGIYLGLDQIGTRIWQLLQEDGSLHRVMEVMLAEYDVTQEKLAADLLNLVGQMEKQGLLSVAK